MCCIRLSVPFFFFNDTATTEIYTLSLHDALPISRRVYDAESNKNYTNLFIVAIDGGEPRRLTSAHARSEEHTSELQSRLHLVCRLLLEKKKTIPENASLGNPSAHDRYLTPTTQQQ